MLYNTKYVKQNVIFYADSVVSSLLQVIVYRPRRVDTTCCGISIVFYYMAGQP